MTVEEQVLDYVASLPPAKCGEMQRLDRLVRRISPRCKLWFLDGKNEEGRTVSNPNIGYGTQTIKYAGGETREFYQIGLSANSSGISLYIIGIEDKKLLPRFLGERLGKAKITGYCIKFRTLREIDMEVLEEAIRLGFEATSG